MMGTAGAASRLTGIREDCFAGGIMTGRVNPLLIAGMYGHINTVSRNIPAN